MAKVLGLFNRDMRSNQQPLERFGVITVVLHFIVLVAHSVAHLSLHIDASLWQSVYIFLVIVALPLLAGFLLWRRARGGFTILFCSMLGALIFGAYYHFIAAGTDNVSSLGSGPSSTTFQVTAVLLALTEAAGVLTGVLGLFTERTPRTSA